MQKHNLQVLVYCVYCMDMHAAQTRSLPFYISTCSSLKFLMCLDIPSICSNICTRSGWLCITATISSVRPSLLIEPRSLGNRESVERVPSLACSAKRAARLEQKCCRCFTTSWCLFEAARCSGVTAWPSGTGSAPRSNSML